MTNAGEPLTGARVWHALPADAVLTALGADGEQGLGAAEVRARAARHGPNRLREQRPRPWWRIFLRQFADFMILVLLAAAFISGVLGDPVDTVAILFIVVLNAVIGAVQAHRADRALAALRALATPAARVVRAGAHARVASTDLVPGDLVLVEAGDIVPADLRLLEAVELAVDESALTGESGVIAKDAAAVLADATALGERCNLLYKGSLVSAGRARGVVVAIGTATEIGRIAELLGQQKRVLTPLQERLARFGRQLALAVLAICTLVFISGLLQGQPTLLMFLTAVSLAVAAIPEALPAVVTVSLAFGARHLSRNRALVRNLPAVETLGAVTYICTDKTGTLTQNRMTVEAYLVAGERHATLPRDAAAPWRELCEAMAISNDVILRDGAAAGEATELALHAAAGLDKAVLEAAMPRCAEIPFDSARQRMVTVHTIPTGYRVIVKGAPEAVLPLCIHQHLPDGVVACDARAAAAAAASLAAEGYRVLAIAQRELATLPAAAALEAELTLLGIVGLIDPPRPEVPAAVAACRAAGITPVMVTGDHVGTAQAIAVRLGILRADEAVMSGAQLAALSEDEFARRVQTVHAYARVTPEQKTRIVRALQARGEFVAMTGDGVNDAPALKRAGIGIAMGRKGTDVAREAADLVLLDDNFATIVQAVRAGRRIFDNIRKFIKDAMSSNSGEIWTLFLAPFLGLPVPLLPIHILWINLVTDGLPGLAFTAEPEEPGLMARPPRAPDENLFAHGMWQHILWFGLYVAALAIGVQAWLLGQDADYWQTAVFTVLTFSQLFHSLAIRAERASLLSIGVTSNLPMLGAVGLTVILQLGIVYVPALNPIFGTAPLPWPVLLVCCAVSATVLLVVEVEKWLVRAGLLYRT